MARPNFFIIGAAKAGTTSLAYYLSLQPDIFFSNPKELNFFCDPGLYPAEIPWYEGHFANSYGKRAIGEGSPPYTSCGTRPGTAENIFNYEPSAKLIYLVRHPLERMKSHYLQLLNNGYCGRISFYEALNRYPELLDSSLYWKQISEYRRFFKDEQIQVLFFEELKSRPDLIVQRCCKFLEVPFYELPVAAYEIKNATKDHYEDRWFFQVIKNLAPLNYEVLGSSPALRKLARKLLRKQQQPAPELTPVTAEVILPLIKSDLKEFLDYSGKAVDYYRIPQIEEQLMNQNLTKS